MEGAEYFQPGFCSQFANENRQSSDPNKTTVVPPSASAATADHFIVEDLLDFSNDDDVVFTDGTFDNQTPTSTDSSTLTLLDSCNSYPNFEQHNNAHNYNFADANFSTDLGVPYDDLAELEWLSNFVEDSFSTDDLEKLSLISGMNSRTDHDDDASKTSEFQTGLNRNHSSSGFRPEMSVPAKAARSKRSRAAPCIWNSRLSVLSPTNSSSETDVVVTLTPHPNTAKKTAKKKETPDDTSSAGNGEGRKCLHCATDKTPQWRTGPMGPKTLCNACGVRYKSGRLVPEYRPAASPTFVLTKHSNSHRKVMELRRQKEMMRSQQQQQYLHHESMGFDHVSNDDDYLIHQHIGPLYQ